MTLPRNCQYLSQLAGRSCLMEEVVVPLLGISRSKGMTSRLVQTVQLSWSLQHWNLMRANGRAAAEAELSLPCVLLSNRETLVSKVSRSTCKSWNVQYTGNSRTWNNITRHSMSLHQWFKIAGLWKSWTCTLEWPKQAAQVGKGLLQAPIHELLFA